MIFFLIFSKLVWNFGISSAPVYRDRELYGMVAKSWDFLETFLPEGAEFFIWTFLKVH